jgi:group I intron endonuclease
MEYSRSSVLSRSMLIYKAISKHGLSNFEFEILEYCGSDNIEVREQAFIDLIKPEYNLNCRVEFGL